MDLTQPVIIESASTYQIRYTISVVGTAQVALTEDYINTITDVTNATYTDTFVRLGATGNYNLSVITSGATTSVTLFNISLRKLTVATNDNIPVKEFLTGNTDEGGVIFFRADTQILQLQPSPQLYSNPIALATEIERGTQTKIFMSMDDKPFLQLEGTVTKGVSILKPATSSNIDSLDESKTPLAKSIQLSFRDSSKNLCRIIQAAVITVPTPIDYVP
jgi:putative lipoic acid-binding regulatory protein